LSSQGRKREAFDAQRPLVAKRISPDLVVLAGYAILSSVLFEMFQAAFSILFISRYPSAPRFAPLTNGVSKPAARNQNHRCIWWMKGWIPAPFSPSKRWI
jgi:folate-dependent phosphoribosylglycinamide formyltransferase PurN